jgi:hypothetical protein
LRQLLRAQLAASAPPPANLPTARPPVSEPADSVSEPADSVSEPADSETPAAATPSEASKGGAR